MKALVYNGTGKKSVEERPKPEISAPTDAIVKIVKTTICGTDLHILKGDVPTCAPGRILGHEGIGIVDKVGSAVTGFQAGDRVIVSCISSCGKMRLLPSRHVFPLRRRRLDTRQQDRRYPSGICPHSLCRYQSISHSGRRG